ncbi:hypothetical protein C3R74_11475 [Acidithiobacillus ferridurans]|uniref:hypothetical protein n=1 Tax=Acidithiobacillus ferridurans TaxID=1232575 RepID=UPI000DE237D9|nr:hypothetical protein [Acidithiobacillus ferridurans]RBL99132.1 hypothetical protein C3R74_11475 [Acidithiobacillus ferridurans]
MGVADDVKQAVQAFLIPELDAIKAQIAEVRGVQTQMSERLSEQAAQVLEISRRIDSQRQELKESMREMETRLESRMDRIESRLDRQNDKLDQILMLLAPHARTAGG